MNWRRWAGPAIGRPWTGRDWRRGYGIEGAGAALFVGAHIEIEMVTNQRARGDAGDGFDMHKIAFAIRIANETEPAIIVPIDQLSAFAHSVPPLRNIATRRLSRL